MYINTYSVNKVLICLLLNREFRLTILEELNYFFVSKHITLSLLINYYDNGICNLKKKLVLIVLKEICLVGLLHFNV